MDDALFGSYAAFFAEIADDVPSNSHRFPDEEIGCCRGALQLVPARDSANLLRVVARYATQALPRYTGVPKTKPCDLWCDLAASFWHFWYFENFVSCITYVFSV